MFRFFENMVDPFGDYQQTDTPPQKLGAFLWDYSQPFKRLYVYCGLVSVVVATVEVLLLWYMGRLVDVLNSGTPAEIWRAMGKR